MSDPKEPDVYDEEGQFNEASDNDDDDDDDIFLPPSPFSAPTPGDEEEMSDDDDDENADRNNVDLCILCDVTDSMNEWIDEIKNGIRRIVSELKNTFGIGTLRLSFVGYRDWNDDNNNKGQKRIEKLKFTTNINTFEQFVQTVEPIGGGDAAEDVLGGIAETLSISWKSPIRVLYHICDAAPHGTMYHDYYDNITKCQHVKNDFMSFLDGVSDSDSGGDSDAASYSDSDEKQNDETLRDEWDKWPDKHPNDAQHEDLFMMLQKKNVQYYIGTKTSYTDKMLNVFNEFCDSIDYRLTPMDLLNVSNFLPTLIEAVSDAIRICVPPKKRRPININLEKLQKKKVNFQVHCGIDFGTAGSGFAYSLPGTNKVYTDQDWNNSGKHVDVKTKTNILLDINGNCIAFGDDATDKYTHTDTNDLFFERFKMALYEKEMVLNDDEKQQENNYFQSDIRQYLTAANGKELPARKVLEEAIRFMKDHAMNNLRNRVNKNLKIENVQWILTVPAIWSDTAKSVMKTAAINAGMVNESIEGQLIIAYEPDCASLSILHEINEKARDMHKQQQRIKREKLAVAQNVEAKENEAIVSEHDDDDYKSFFERGDKILLCDLGGGTADIACHELDQNERIRQIVFPSGGAWGSTYVDQHFLNLLDDIFSKQWMNEFKKEEPSQYIAFLQNFRNAKKTYKMNEKKKVKKKEYDTTFHNIKVPYNFIAFMEEKVADLDDDDTVLSEQDDDDDMLGNIVKNFSKFGKKGLMALNGEYLELSYTIWNYLFDQVVDCIVCHCKKLLLLPEMDSCKYLCLVGGFSESKHLQAKMFSNFGRKSRYNLHIFTPMRPVLSVVDGAARMGLKPDFISARTIAKTYGIAIQKDLFEFKSIYPHSVVPKIKVSKRLVYSKHNKKQMISKQVINDVFLPFVRKNTLIRNNDKPVIYWVEAADIKANKISIRLYDSYESDPMFVDDKRQANKIEVELSDSYKLNKEPIPIIFIFNDTTIRVFVDMIQADGKHKTKEISLNFDVLR